MKLMEMGLIWKLIDFKLSESLYDISSFLEGTGQLKASFFLHIFIVGIQYHLNVNISRYNLKYLSYLQAQKIGLTTTIP